MKADIYDISIFQWLFNISMKAIIVARLRADFDIENSQLQVPTSLSLLLHIYKIKFHWSFIQHVVNMIIANFKNIFLQIWLNIVFMSLVSRKIYKEDQIRRPREYELYILTSVSWMIMSVGLLKLFGNVIKLL